MIMIIIKLVYRIYNLKTLPSGYGLIIFSVFIFQVPFENTEVLLFWRIHLRFYIHLKWFIWKMVNRKFVYSFCNHTYPYITFIGESSIDLNKRM